MSHLEDPQALFKDITAIIISEHEMVSMDQNNEGKGIWWNLR
jgi:hypothetical protein